MNLFVSCILKSLPFFLFFSLAFAQSKSKSKSNNPPRPVAMFAHVPTTLILVSETSQQFFIMPFDAQSSPQSVEKQFLPCYEYMDSSSAEKKLSAAATFSERCGALVWLMEKHLGKFQLDISWSKRVVDFVKSSQKLQSTSGVENKIWPPVVPFAASTLKNGDGLIIVIVFKQPETMAVLDKIDLIRISDEKVTRAYWSRNLNDPTLTETFTGALEKASQNFLKVLKNPPQQASLEENKIKLFVDKKVSERDLLVLENVIKGIAKNGSEGSVMVPYGVSKSEVLYNTALEASQMDPFMEKLQGAAPQIFIKKSTENSTTYNVGLAPIVKEKQ